jgi:hypothetical protein
MEEGALSDLRMVTHLKSVCRDFGCIRHCLCMTCSYSEWLFPDFLATRVALDSRDFMVWLALLGVPRVVPLAFVEVAVAIALLVMVALGETVVFLVVLVGPPCHHVTQLHGSSRAVARKVVVRVLREEAVLEATDDVLIGDVGERNTVCKTSRSRSSPASTGTSHGECPP